MTTNSFSILSFFYDNKYKEGDSEIIQKPNKNKIKNFYFSSWTSLLSRGFKTVLGYRIIQHL